MIHVVYLIDDLAYMSGVQRNLLELVKDIDRTRYEVYVLSLFKVEGVISDEFKKYGANVTFLNFNKLDITSYIRFYRFIRNNDIKVIYCIPFISNIIGPIVGKLANIPVIIQSFQGLWKDEGMLYKLIMHISLKFSDKVIAASKTVFDLLIKHYRIPPHKIAVVYNCIDLGRFNYNESFSSVCIDIKKKLDINSKHVILGNVNFFKEEKNLDVLITTMPLILKEFNNVKLILVGRGHLEGHLRALVDKLKLNNHVLFFGYIPNPESLFKIFDIYVSSSATEGFSLSILEAMAAGLPVVATDIGAHREAVSDGITGLLVTPNDPEALALAINRLINDKQLARMLGEEGHKRAKDNFTSAESAKILQSIYEDLLYQKS